MLNGANHRSADHSGSSKGCGGDVKGTRKRVLFVSSQPFFQWRGSPIRVGFDVQALAELGFDVDLLTLPVGEDKDIPGVRLIRVPNLFLARNVAIGPSCLKAAFDVLLLFYGVGLVCREKYDVIHCVEDASVPGAALARIRGSRLIFEKHSDPSSYRKGLLRNLVMSLYARLERFAVRRADAVIGTGPGLVDQARKMAPGKTVYNIFDIPSSLVEFNVATTEKIREELKTDESQLLITYVGSFAMYQGIDLMFQAIPAVVHKCPRARFVIVGGTPQEISERKEWLRGEQAGDSVTFVGKIPPDQLPDYLCAADILLSPRLAGVNTPLKLLDYLKAGRAILATDTSANRLILDENTAVLVEANVSAFTEGICRLADEPNLRIELGKNGRRLIEEKFNYEQFRRRLGDCYEGVLGKDE